MELPPLTNSPVRHPQCCLSLSRRLLDTLGRALQAHVGPAGLVLSVGCGTGLLEEHLHRRVAAGGLRVEGVERVPEGTTHCVDVRELSPTLLEVDLTEYPPGADPVLIRQRVRVAENPDGTWGIVSITPAG